MRPPDVAARDFTATRPYQLALEQAVYDRAGDLDGLVRHSDCGTQDLSIRYTARLMEAGIEPSVGSRAIRTATR